jgi:hypothetical protein
MGMFDWMAFEKGQARFCGGLRNTLDDSGAFEIFAEQLNGRRPYYVRYITPYEADHTHYNVPVLSFGNPRLTKIGLPAPTARAAFAPSDIKDIRSLIQSLMRVDMQKPVPMQHPERFLGEVFFKEGWIRES